MFMRKTFEDIFPPKDIKEAVFAVLSFFDIFDCPLTKDEIQKFMMFKGTDVQGVDFFLKHNDQISNADGFYFLSGRNETVNKRKKSDDVSKKYWRKINKFVPLLKFVPFIKAVAVCNTLAISCPDEESDIDLFIITEARRVNFARFFSTFFFHLLGIRRHHNKIAGRFCLSFYVAVDGLNFDEIKSEKHDVYLSYWAYTLKPIFGEEYFDKFWSENRDLLKYFNRKSQIELKFRKHKSGSNPRELLPGGSVVDYFEKIILNFHKKRFEKRLSFLPDKHGIVIDDKMLKFHNRDMRSDFNRRFRERYLALLV